MTHRGQNVSCVVHYLDLNIKIVLKQLIKAVRCNFRKIEFFSAPYWTKRVVSHTGLNYAENTKRVYHADLNCQIQAIVLISRCPGSVVVSRLSTGLQFLRRQWKMPLRNAFRGVVAARMGNTKGVPRSAPQKSMLYINSVSVLCQVQFQRGNTQTASLVNTS